MLEGNYNENNFLRAAYYGRLAELIMCLTKNPALDIDARDVSGATALHWMAYQGYADGIDLLLRHGANPNATNKRGQTPLHLAVCWDYSEIVKLLIEYSADVNVMDCERLTPLHLVSAGAIHNSLSFCYVETFSFVEFLKIQNYHYMPVRSKIITAASTKLLLSNGADVNAFNKGRHTPLHWAIIGEIPEIIELIDCKGAKLNDFDIALLKDYKRMRNDIISTFS